MAGVLKTEAPKRKQEVLIPKKKRVQRRMRPKEDGEDSEEIGTKIPQNVTSMSLALQPKCKREDFKHWKPWVKD